MSFKTHPGNTLSDPEQNENEVWVDVPIDQPKNRLEFEEDPQNTPNAASDDNFHHIHIKNEFIDSEGLVDGWRDSHAEIRGTDNRSLGNGSEDNGYHGDDASEIGQRIKQEISDVGEFSYAEQASNQIPASPDSKMTDVQLLNSFEIQLSSPCTVKQSNTKKYFVCDICRDTFLSPVSLNNHKQKHKNKPRQTPRANEKLFACGACDFKSAHVSSLKKHAMSHTGERPFKCNLCEFACTESSNLNRHKMNHSGEKPFKCDECQFKTINSSHLKRHIRSHTGEKPFACDQCAYKSANSSHLKTHYMVHTGEKPYQCGQCEFKSRNSSHLKRHAKCHEKKILIR